MNRNTLIVIDKTLSLTRDKKALSPNLRKIVYKFVSVKLILRKHAGLMSGRDLYAKQSISTNVGIAGTVFSITSIFTLHHIFIYIVRDLQYFIFCSIF